MEIEEYLRKLVVKKRDFGGNWKKCAGGGVHGRRRCGWSQSLVDHDWARRVGHKRRDWLRPKSEWMTPPHLHAT